MLGSFYYDRHLHFPGRGGRPKLPKPGRSFPKSFCPALRAAGFDRRGMRDEAIIQMLYQHIWLLKTANGLLISFTPTLPTTLLLSFFHDSIFYRHVQ